MVVDPEEIAFNKLTGKYKHYCCEWDDMAIDETCPEFLACSCYGTTIPISEWDTIQRKLRDYIMVEDNRHAQLP